MLLFKVCQRKKLLSQLCLMRMNFSDSSDHSAEVLFSYILFSLIQLTDRTWTVIQPVHNQLDGYTTAKFQPFSLPICSKFSKGGHYASCLISNKFTLRGTNYCLSFSLITLTHYTYSKNFIHLITSFSPTNPTTFWFTFQSTQPEPCNKMHHWYVH